jgi:5-formyltetrahydrofolate cyclo-ligase
MDSKADLRRIALEHRATLSAPADAFAAHAEALALAPGAVVAGYAAFRDEADPAALMAALAAKGHPLALPRIAAKRAPLVFHRWRQGEPLGAHQFGMAEPDPAAATVTPDVLLVPLLAFDAQGWRLGYGGGFYDCTLAKLRAAKTIFAVGLAFTGQEIAAVSHDAHDQRLDAILTENGLTRF